jgi:hypothetical protein
MNQPRGLGVQKAVIQSGIVEIIIGFVLFVGQHRALSFFRRVSSDLKSIIPYPDGMTSRRKVIRQLSRYACRPDRSLILDKRWLVKSSARHGSGS